MLVVSDHGAKRLDGGHPRERVAAPRGPARRCSRSRTASRRRARSGSTGRGRPRGARAATTRASSSTSRAASRRASSRRPTTRRCATTSPSGSPRSRTTAGRPLATHVYKPEEVYPEVHGVAPDLIVIFGDLLWRSVGTIGGDGGRPHARERHRPRRRQPRAGRAAASPPARASAARGHARRAPARRRADRARAARPAGAGATCADTASPRGSGRRREPRRLRLGRAPHRPRRLLRRAPGPHAHDRRARRVAASASTRRSPPRRGRARRRRRWSPGLYPHHHGYLHWDATLDPALPTLFTVAAANGYTTGSFVFDENYLFKGFADANVAGTSETLDGVVEWLRAHRLGAVSCSGSTAGRRTCRTTSSTPSARSGSPRRTRSSRASSRATPRRSRSCARGTRASVERSSETLPRRLPRGARLARAARGDGARVHVRPRRVVGRAVRRQGGGEGHLPHARRDAVRRDRRGAADRLGPRTHPARRRALAGQPRRPRRRRSSTWRARRSTAWTASRSCPLSAVRRRERPGRLDRGDRWRPRLAGRAAPSAVEVDGPRGVRRGGGVQARPRPARARQPSPTRSRESSANGSTTSSKGSSSPS